MLVFAEPLLLIAIPVVLLAGIGLYFLAEKRAFSRLHRFASSHIAQRLIDSHSRSRLWIKHGLFLAVLVLCIFSLARPQWGAVWEKSETRGIDILIALDTSRSMLAEDIRPNRLERSRLAILDLLQEVRGDRVGLIAFSGSAFLQCPLTLDYQAFRQTLAAISTETIPRGGTNVAAAIEEALAYFDDSANAKLLILITDGEDLGASGIEAARDAAAEGLRILTVGVGSARGELIPITGPDGQRTFLRDQEGNPVSTSLDAATLQAIAAAANGVYAPLGPTGSGLEEVYQFSLEQMPARDRNETIQRIPIERFQWPLLAALLLLLVESVLSTRRRGRLANTLTGLLIFGALALQPDSVLAGPVKEAGTAFAEERYEEAVTLYREALDPESPQPGILFNMGVAAYRSGDWETAIGAFVDALPKGGTRLQRKAFYNAGNARVARGFELLESEPATSQLLWQTALQDYTNAEALDPDFTEAAANKQQLESVIAAHTYRFTATAIPEEAGAVEPSEAILFHGLPLQVKALPVPGWEFDRWEGLELEDPTTPSVTLQLTKSLDAVAYFAKTWNLTVESADPEQGTAGESGTYREATDVTITAEAVDYFAFTHWETDTAEIADEKAAETTLTLEADAVVTANFTPAFKLTVELEPEIGGQAGPSGFFPEFSVQPIQAEPRPGFRWDQWIGDGIEDLEAQQTTIVLTEDRIAVARMIREWNLVIIPNPEEGGTVEGAGDHPVGSTVEISATPNEGFEFVGWQGPGVADPSAAQTTVTVESEEHTLFANFQQSDDDSQDDQQQDQQDDSNQDQQDPENQQDQQDSSNEDESSESEEQEANSEEEESEPESGEEEQPQEEQPQEEEPAEPEQQEGSPEETEANPTPLSMTPEEARQLLNALSEDERYLPAAEEAQEALRNTETPPEKDW
jgi:Ca-activated chloride channel family protein